MVALPSLTKNLSYNQSMIKKITLTLLMTFGLAYAVETEPAKNSHNCIGKTTTCKQMTYHFTNDDDDIVYLYQDFAGYWHIYGDDVHDLDEKTLAGLLRNADAQQNQSDLNDRNKFNEVLF